MPVSDLTQKDRTIPNCIVFFFAERKAVMLSFPRTENIKECMVEVSREWTKYLNDEDLIAVVAIDKEGWAQYCTPKRFRWLCGVGPDSKDINWLADWMPTN